MMKTLALKAWKSVPDLGAVGSVPVMLLILVLGFHCACSGPGLDSPSGREPEYSLLWISLDTVRADHLGLYGYERPTSPFLDKLAREDGLYFEWAISPQNSTLPTHLTMFTGYHPAVHKVMHSRRNPGIRLRDDVLSFTQVLADAGFATRAWVDGGKLEATYGFDRGFLQYEDRKSLLAEKMRAMLDAIDRGIDDGKRFFYFLHTYHAHAPYQPEKNWTTPFATEGQRDEAQELMDRYDGTITYLDNQVRHLVDELEKRKLLDSTIVMITGDHGENFKEYESHKVGHAASLHQNIVRVPWIMLHPDPKYRGRSISELVGLIDFPATALGLLGVSGTLPDGVNVLAEDVPPNRAYASWNGRNPDPHWSLYKDRYHLLQSPDSDPPLWNALYDRIEDPLETHPLDNPQLLHEMSTELRRIRGRLREQAERLPQPLHVSGEIDPDLRQQLKALGYL